jgi:hypothetical protein
MGYPRQRTYMSVLALLAVHMNDASAAPLAVPARPGLFTKVSECVAEGLKKGEPFEIAALSCIGFCPQENTFDLSDPIAANTPEESEQPSEDVLERSLMAATRGTGTGTIVTVPPLPVLVDDSFRYEHGELGITIICNLDWSPLSPRFPRVLCICGNRGVMPAA